MTESLDLPELLARVAQEVSVGAALRLARDFGGREVYIPEKLGEDHPLIKCLGDEASAVCNLLGAGRILIPMGPQASDRRRARMIADLLDEGRSADQVAARAGVHIRTVKRHRQRARRRDDTPDLFSF